MFFQRDEWTAGIPEPRSIKLLDYRMPRTRDVVPIFRVADFKGLESDVVVLLLRGRSAKHREMVYVGVSRARYLLVVLADRAGGSTIPQSFVWDRTGGEWTGP